jgi:HAD superfamily hydrolase (TIGR01662 family)
MAKLEAIIFDLGDTLIYFSGSWAEVLSQANRVLARSLRLAGLGLEEAAFLDSFEREMNDYYRERDSEFIEHTTYTILCRVLADLGLAGIPEVTLRGCLREMYAVFQRHWLAEEESVPALQACKAHGYRLGMVSNTADDGNVQTLVDQVMIRPYFDRIITSAAAGIRKPNPRIFRPLLDEWKIPPDRVAMVGDTLGADILGAHNAGMFAIWVTRRADTAGNRAHRDTIFPDAVIESVGDLPAFLKAWEIT